MNASHTPFHVVVAGAGVAALEAALALRALAGDLVRVELIAPETEFIYRPLAVAEPFRTDEVRRFPLEPLVDATGAALRRDSLASVEPAERRAQLASGEAVEYDAFVLAVGTRPRDAVVGALTFRGPQDGQALVALLEQATAGHVQRLAFVVPAGVSWPLPLYELALQTGSYLSDHGTRGVELVIVTPEEHPLSIFGREASSAIAELLQIRGIELDLDFECACLCVLREGRGQAELCREEWREVVPDDLRRRPPEGLGVDDRAAGLNVGA